MFKHLMTAAAVDPFDTHFKKARARIKFDDSK
jgi:hypothetical protein